jgi:hypothetical protein
MGSWRDRQTEKYERQVDQFLAQVFESGEALGAAGLTVDLDAIVEVSPGGPSITQFMGPIGDAIDAAGVVRMFKKAAVVLVAVTDRRVVVAAAKSSGLGDWRHVLSIPLPEVTEVTFKRTLNQTLTFRAPGLAFKGTMGRWTPSASRYSNLEEVALALGYQG